MRWKTTFFFVITLYTLCDRNYKVLSDGNANESLNTIISKVIEKNQSNDGTELFKNFNKSPLVGENELKGKNVKGRNNADETKVVQMNKRFKGHLGEIKALKTIHDNYNWNDPKNRFAPPPPAYRNHTTYTINSARLSEIRSHLLYPFHDHGGPDGHGDYQEDINYSIAQIHKQLNFNLPFFGFIYNYTRLSANGFLEFSNPPPHYTYPLKFPYKNWPKENDPAFIGIFYSKCRIGDVQLRDIDLRRPGVYFRIERDLKTRTDQYGVELRERLMWDIREGIIGTEIFVPSYAVIVTWKNMTFSGGTDGTLKKTNTFQLVLATDEVYTYAIFNYVDINWSSHTEAGGDTVHGNGGVPAYIGFNAGNGTRSFEYKPYSQAALQHLVTERGWVNGFPGRHIFRIDEKILAGACTMDLDEADSLLYVAPESGNMLGGTIVNVTGPCFDIKTPIKCIFGIIEVNGVFVDRNRAICVQPFLSVQGYINLEVILSTNEHRKWRTRYFVETPDTATEKISFEGMDVYAKSPQEIKFVWQNGNLTSNSNANVRISLWGYKETENMKHVTFIDILEESIVNSGKFMFILDKIKKNNKLDNLDIEVGLLQINLTHPQKVSGVLINPVLWSKPIPLAWYFNTRWEKTYGNEWPEILCNKWIERDRKLKPFTNQLPICPCTIKQALNDKGRFMPDVNCDKDGNTRCLFNNEAIHCIKSITLSLSSAEQQCCYDKSGYLMLSYDYLGGSRPKRKHNHAEVPSLSQFFNDQAAFHSCCVWQTARSDGCEIYRFERRSSQDCVAYQPPAVASVFGDPHIITFDSLEYTFNGLGEFVLLRTVGAHENIQIQGRFEQVPRTTHGTVKATRLAAIVIKGNSSDRVEVRTRPQNSQSNYHLDVFLNGVRTYFDRNSLRQQFFNGIIAYMPSQVSNQSHIVVTLSSGVGVEIKESFGYVAANIYIPWNYINKTRGLLGNFSWNTQDDFMLPNGHILEINSENLEVIHKMFALKWLLSDTDEPNIGKSLFLKEYGRTSKFYTNELFVPNFNKEPRDFLPSNHTKDILIAHEICKDSYQCRYDYGMSLNNATAIVTKMHRNNLLDIKKIYEERVMSCGVLETPRYGKKSTLEFIPGTVVTFECQDGFTLIGDLELECKMDGRWSEGKHGYTDCIRSEEFLARTTSISISIIVLIIVPLSLILIIVARQHFKKKWLEQEDILEKKHWQQVETMRLQQQEILDAMENKKKIDEENEPSFIETPL